MKKYLDLRNEIDYTKIKEPAEIIKKGGIVIFPTETVYGIGVNGLDEKAVKKLYDIKQRPLNKPISLLVSDIVTAGQDTVGIRMPSGEIARKLIEYAKVPIATPSANISGKPSGTNLDEIMEDFEGKVDYFIDGGDSKLGVASTIVKVVDGIPYILRQGTITKEQIEEIAGEAIFEYE